MSLINEHYLSSVNIFLSSDDADLSPSSSRRVWYLKKPLSIPKNSHMMVALTSFVMPYSFYLVQEGLNDSFKISTYYEGTWVEQVITIPTGNYTVADLLPAINNLLITYEGTLRTLFTLVKNYTTNKLYFTTSVQMDQIIFSDVKCFKFLGINKDETQTFDFLSTLEMPNMSDFSGTSCLYITMKHKHIQNVSSSHVDGVLQQVNVECLPFQYIIFKPIEYQYFETSTDHITHFDISILNENFKEIELNGGVFKLTLTIHYNYNKPVILDDQHLTLKQKEEEKKEKKK